MLRVLPVDLGERPATAKKRQKTIFIKPTTNYRMALFENKVSNELGAVVQKDLSKKLKLIIEL